MNSYTVPDYIDLLLDEETQSAFYATEVTTQSAIEMGLSIVDELPEQIKSTQQMRPLEEETLEQFLARIQAEGEGPEFFCERVLVHEL